MPRGELRVLLPTVVLVAALTAFLTRRIQPAGPPPALPSSIDRVLALVRDRYVDPVDEQELVRVAADAMLRRIGDPYAAFLAGPALSAYRARLTGSATGLGLQVGVREGRLTVLAVVPGTGADAAGIRPGDRILAIDGTPTTGITVVEGMYLLDEAGPGEVELAVQWGVQSMADSLILTRSELPDLVVSAAGMLDPATGYLALRGVSDGARDRVMDLVDSLVALGADGLILDLRGNGGGRFREGVRVADLFLPDGTVIAERERRGSAEIEQVKASGPERWPHLRVAVLVDGATASAAEVIAGALQARGRARLFGEPTYGKNAAQDLFDVGDGTMLRLTTGRWRLPSGDTLSRGDGLHPDVEALPRSKDPVREQWRAALGDRLPRFEGTVRRFAAGWVTSCGGAAPKLRDPNTWRTLRRALAADSLLVPAVTARAARPALERYVTELGVMETCGEPAWRLRAQLDDPVTSAARAALAADTLTTTSAVSISP